MYKLIYLLLAVYLLLTSNKRSEANVTVVLRHNTSSLASNETTTLTICHGPVSPYKKPPPGINLISLEANQYF